MDDLKNLPRIYEPGEVESRWYGYWMEKGLFRPDPDPNKKAYSIVMPPPNVTGSLHLVDFGDQAGLPKLFKAGLCKWLEQFHVSPRVELPEVLAGVAATQPVEVEHRWLYRGYAQIACIRRLS